ncbi:MAG: hypothetical protein LUG51_11250 [Tannerellaceae bacterium]|nr:hypothetical protein [Tannerellaceae bacterium]
MESQFQYIRNLAKRFSLYNMQSKELFKALRELPAEILIQVTDEYWNPEANFQPVNLLRATIAKKLLEGEVVKEEDVEDIKTQIRRKNRDYFSYLPERYLQQLSNYPVKKKDMFDNWQKYWYILHPFFTGEQRKRKPVVILRNLVSNY